MKRAFDQHAAKARAIDEHVAGDPLAALQHDMADVVLLAVQRNVDDLALGPFDAARLGMATQEPGIEAGIEMERPGQAAGVLRGSLFATEAVRGRSAGACRMVRQRAANALRPTAQPVRVEGQDTERPADRPECVEIAAAIPRPAGEFDPELERRTGRADERVLVDAQILVEQPDLRDRRLADADDADRIGFDEPDTRAARPEPRPASPPPSIPRCRRR